MTLFGLEESRVVALTTGVRGAGIDAADAGWRVEFREASYVYYAKHSKTGARLSYFEGDLFEGIR